MNSAINSQTGKYDRIPVLDMGPYLAGEPSAREQLAAQLRHVQENIGFYVVTNNGVEFSRLDAAYEA